MVPRWPSIEDAPGGRAALLAGWLRRALAAERAVERAFRSRGLPLPAALSARGA